MKFLLNTHKFIKSLNKPFYIQNPLIHNYFDSLNPEASEAYG